MESNQSIYDKYIPGDAQGVITSMTEAGTIGAAEKIGHAFSLIDAMVEIEFEEMRGRIEEIIPSESNSIKPLRNMSRPYDWAADEHSAISESADSYVRPLFPKIYDWATDGVMDELLQDNTQLFQYHVSDHEVDAMELPADKKGLFADYTATGLTDKFLDNKADISDADQDKFFNFVKDNDEKKSDLKMFLGSEKSSLRIKVRRAIGAAALSASLLAGSLFGASQIDGKEMTNEKVDNTEYIFLHQELAANNRPAAPIVIDAAPAEIAPLPAPKPDSTKNTPAQNKELGRLIAINEFGYSEKDFACLDGLWTRESGWDHTANNPTSSAIGIIQEIESIHKLGVEYTGPLIRGVEGRPATYDYAGGRPELQIKWGLSYIKGKYTTACNALAKWKSRSPHWY